METETLLAISAGATFLLALAAFWAIWQNYRLREKDRKERLLNEIIEWAVDVSACASPLDILGNPEWLLGTNLDEEEKIRFMQIFERIYLMSQFSVLKQHGEYISRVASRIRKDLGKAVDDLISKMEKHVKVLFDAADHTAKFEEYGTLIDIIFRAKTELRDELSENGKYQLDVFDDRAELNESATRVVEVAVEIKTSIR